MTLSASAIERTVGEILRERLCSGGTVRFVVASTSMRPLLQPGDLAEVAWREPELVRPGMIVVQRFSAAYRIHRVVAISSADGVLAFETRGDSNGTSDPAAPDALYLGVLTAILRPGGVRVVLDTPAGRRFERGSLAAAKRLRIRQRIRNEAARFTAFLATHPRAASVLRLPYQACIAAVRRALGGPSISLYVTRSVASGDYHPGLSDLDCYLVVDQADASALEQIVLKLLPRVQRLRMVFPFFSSPAILGTDLFEAWQQWGGFRALEVPRWRLISGAEKRCRRESPDQWVKQYFSLREFVYYYTSGMPHALRLASRGHKSSARERIDLRKHLVEALRFCLTFTNGFSAPLCAARRGEFLVHHAAQLRDAGFELEPFLQVVSSTGASHGVNELQSLLSVMRQFETYWSRQSEAHTFLRDDPPWQVETIGAKRYVRDRFGRLQLILPSSIAEGEFRSSMSEIHDVRKPVPVMPVLSRVVGWDFPLAGEELLRRGHITSEQARALIRADVADLIAATAHSWGVEERLGLSNRMEAAQAVIGALERHEVPLIEEQSTRAAVSDEVPVRDQHFEQVAALYRYCQRGIEAGGGRSAKR